MDAIEKKIAEKYNSKHPQAAQQAPAQAPPQPPPQEQAPPPPAPKEHHHAKALAGKLGNAAIFGAGATAGADAVNGLIN